MPESRYCHACGALLTTALYCNSCGVSQRVAAGDSERAQRPGAARGRRPSSRERSQRSAAAGLAAATDAYRLQP